MHARLVRWLRSKQHSACSSVSRVSMKAEGKPNSMIVLWLPHMLCGSYALHTSHTHIHSNTKHLYTAALRDTHKHNTAHTLTHLHKHLHTLIHTCIHIHKQKHTHSPMQTHIHNTHTVSYIHTCSDIHTLFTKTHKNKVLKYSRSMPAGWPPMNCGLLAPPGFFAYTVMAALCPLVVLWLNSTVPYSAPTPQGTSTALGKVYLPPTPDTRSYWVALAGT